MVGIMGALLWSSDEYNEKNQKRADACESEVTKLEQKIKKLEEDSQAMELV